MTNADFQQWVRIVLYNVFAALTGNGVTIPDGTKQMIVGLVGILATAIWTLYGSRLNSLLAQVRARTGVQSVQITVDPAVIPPATVTDKTPPGVTAKAA